MNTIPTQIDFIESHQPALESGEYRITVEQTLDDVGTKITEQTYGVQKAFYVAGERFHILPQHIGGTFPPANSLGEHSHVLPHLMLSRTTLPWEREAVPGDTQTPWLGLLLIHEAEAADTEVAVVNLSDLEPASNSTPYFPGLNLEPGQDGADKVTVLDIKRSLLDTILPTIQALNFLSHIRQGTDDADGVTGEELAVLVANRLPQKGAINTVHLVSFENRYNPDGSFNYQTAGNDDMIRLVKLFSWPFTSTEHFKVTEGFLQDASDLPDGIKTKLLPLTGREFFTESDFTDALTNDAGLTPTELADNQNIIFKDFAYGDFAGVLKHLDRQTTTLRLPDVGNADTDAYLKMGFYPLPHEMRQGGQTASWYHGPLSPESNAETFAFPAKSSDALLRYYEANGMFDVSYAAAWELGRLLALQNTHFSTELYRWKRRYARSLRHTEQRASHGTTHLQGANRDATPEALPDTLRNWFEALHCLKGIPFHYLIPDEKLLPVESIRFFQLDKLWMEALFDGAFGIGRVTTKDHELDTLIAQEELDLLKPLVTGFILRSEAVSGWPGLQLEGYQTMPQGNDEAPITDAEKIPLLYRTNLSDNVMLCLFEGDLQTLDLHLKPEVLHFGLSPKAGGGYEKELRDSTGLENPAHKVDVVLDSHQVIQLDTLIGDIQTLYNANSSSVAWVATPTSANLALQLLEGVEKVRFIRST